MFFVMNSQLAELFEQEYSRIPNYHAVLLFNTELELGISNEPEKWVCTNIKRFDNGVKALRYYANTPNPASQLVSGETVEELEVEIKQMQDNFKNKDWLKNCLYPYM